MSEHEHVDWRPDDPQPEYPPLRANDMERATKPTAWQRAMAERKAAQEANDPGDADDLGNEPVLWPVGSDLTDEGRRELRRCATAFENQARRLREIVGNE